MVSIRRRILHKGNLIKEQFIRTLQDHEDRLAALESAAENSGSSDNQQQSGGSSDNQQQQEEQQAPVTRDLSFTINDGTDPIEGATVTIGAKTGTTGSAGGCTVTGVEEGTNISVEVSKEGYTTKTETITVDSEHTSFTISLVAVSSP